MNVPKLRFKNAEGADFPLWTISKLGNEVQFSKGGKLGKSDLQKEGSHQCLLYGELYTSYGSIASKIFSRTDTDSDTTSQKYDVVMPTSGETAEDIATATCIPFDGILYGGDLIILRSQTLYGPFLSYQINSSLKRKISRVAQGKSVVHIGAEKIKPISFSFPCLEEQQKIASFFSTLDQKIELNERKLEALEKLKKGLMQKIFSQNIRFKNSDGTNYPEWRTARFFDIVEFIIDFRGRTPKKLGLDWAPSATEYLALSALNVKNWGIDTSAEAHYGDEKLYKKWMTGKELHKGQVLLTTEAPAGIVMQIPDKKKYILSQRVIALNVKQDSISEVFLSQLLKSEKVQQDIRKLSTGGTAIGISQKSLKNLYLYFPSSIQEQQAIGNLFVSLDDKLQLTKKRVEKLQALKRGFMQQMFV